MHYDFVGYGSLLDHKSLKKSVKDKKFKKIIVKGYKRIFDLLDGKNKRDVLNLVKYKGASFNGVMFKVDDRELKKLSMREDEYNFEEIYVYDYNTKKKLGKAIIAIDFFVDIDREKRLPDKKYFIMCRQAAYKIGKDFGNRWDKTTYISDGEKVKDWLKKHKDYDKL